jgi:hypothetical protein
MARTGKHTPAKDPPLDDAQWVLVRKAYNIRSEQLTGGGPSSVAAGDLVGGLRSGKLRCMRRSIENREEVERVPASFWQGRDIQVEANSIHISSPRRDPRDARTRERPWIYYVWEPDIHYLWPTAQAVAPDPKDRKRGKPPTHDWPQVVAAEVIRRIRAPGKKEPTVREMINYCEKTFLKEMQTLLKKLLTGQF